MKAKITSPRNLMITILIVLVFFIFSSPFRSEARTPGVPFAVVEGVQGTVDMTMPGVLQPVKLGYGDMINTRDAITTDAGSKLYLRWQTGVLTSVGGSSSISLGQSEAKNGSIRELKVTTGLLRVTKQSGGGNVTPYMVTTPEVSVEPIDYGAPVDFIVDARLPGTSVVTVIDGPVKVNGLSVTKPMELVVPDCYAALINQGTQQSKMVGSDSNNLDKLVHRTTIPGTIATDFACPVPIWRY